jgi:hypothetical protein
MIGLAHLILSGHYTGGFASIQRRDLPGSQLGFDYLFQKAQRIGLIGI